MTTKTVETKWIEELNEMVWFTELPKETQDSIIRFFITIRLPELRTALIEAGVQKLRGMKKKPTTINFYTFFTEEERGYNQALDDAITALQELNTPHRESSNKVICQSKTTQQ